jgi:hypothetical protein
MKKILLILSVWLLGFTYSYACNFAVQITGSDWCGGFSSAGPSYCTNFEVYPEFTPSENGVYVVVVEISGEYSDRLRGGQTEFVFRFNNDVWERQQAYGAVQWTKERFGTPLDPVVSVRIVNCYSR